MRSGGDGRPEHVLGLEGLRELARRRETDRQDREFEVYVAETVEPVVHHPCDPTHWRIHDRRSFTMDDVAIGDLPIKIELKLRNYKCLACEAANRLGMGEKRTVFFKETIPHRAKGKRATERLFQHIGGRSGKRNFLEIANDTAISDNNVRGVVRRLMNRHMGVVHPAPRVLGMDENKLRGRMRGIVTDIGQKRVLAITEDDGDKLYDYFEAMPGRECTEVVVTDMAPKFNYINNDLFRQAFRVVDKFHVIQRGAIALKHYRLHLLRSSRFAERSIRQQLYFGIKLLTKRYASMKPHEIERLNDIFRHWPEMEEAYHHKEDMYAFYTAETPQEADFMYHHWESEAPEHCAKWFREHANLSDEWKPFVFNYFDWPYTNAFTESMNRKLDDIHREGRRLSLMSITWKLMHQMNRYDVSSEEPIPPPSPWEQFEAKVREFAEASSRNAIWITTPRETIDFMIRLIKPSDPPDCAIIDVWCGTFKPTA